MWSMGLKSSWRPGKSSSLLRRPNQTSSVRRYFMLSFDSSLAVYTSLHSLENVVQYVDFAKSNARSTRRIRCDLPSKRSHGSAYLCQFVATPRTKVILSVKVGQALQKNTLISSLVYTKDTLYSHPSHTPVYLDSPTQSRGRWLNYCNWSKIEFKLFALCFQNSISTSGLRLEQPTLYLYKISSLRLPHKKKGTISQSVRKRRFESARKRDILSSSLSLSLSLSLERALITLCFTDLKALRSSLLAFFSLFAKKKKISKAKFPKRLGPCQDYGRRGSGSRGVLALLEL